MNVAVYEISPHILSHETGRDDTHMVTLTNTPHPFPLTLLQAHSRDVIKGFTLCMPPFSQQPNDGSVHALRFSWPRNTF